MNFIILKIERGRAIIIDQDGEFRTLPALKGWAVGMELDESALEAPRKKLYGKFLRRAGTLVAACLLIGVCFGTWLTRSVESYVDISINPAVRISINRFGTVVGAESINADGLEVLRAISPSKNLVETVRSIVHMAGEKGFLKNGGSGIRLTVASNEPGKAQAMEKELLHQIDSLIAESGISTSIRAQKLSTADYNNLRQELAEVITQNSSAPLESVYESKSWSSGQSLWLEEIEYEGNGILELEFSKSGAWTGHERITIISRDGARLDAAIISQKDDEWTVRCDGLVAGDVYDILVEGAAEGSAEEASNESKFDGCFRANPDSETHNLKTPAPGISPESNKENSDDEDEGVDDEDYDEAHDDDDDEAHDFDD